MKEGQEELDRLRRLAAKDPLTNLWNASYVNQKIIRILAENPGKEYAIIIFDLDYFKNVNDERGHSFGDRVLKYFAEQLSQNIRREALAARISGDEFLVMMVCDETLEQEVKRLYKAVTGKYDGFKVSVSMGIAKTSSIGRDFRELYHCADMALSDAKNKGQGCYTIYSRETCQKNRPTAISPIDRDSAEKGRKL